MGSFKDIMLTNCTYIETLEVYPVTDNHIDELILSDILTDYNFGIEDFLSRVNVCVKEI